MSITAQVLESLSKFVQDGPRRSAGVKVLRGPAVEARVGDTRSMPGASVLKVPLAMWAAQQPTDNRFLSVPVARRELASTAYPSILAAFEDDHVFTIRELLALSLMTSDNPSTSFILDHVDLAAFHSWLASIGCSHTRIRVGFSDSDLGPSGRANETSVDDCMTLLELLDCNTVYQPVKHWLSNNLRNSRMPARLPDNLLVAHKTGSLEGVVNDVGIIYGRAADIALTFLCDGEVDPVHTADEMSACARDIWLTLDS